ncbi:uncharacterized protein [Triticum aestivum]|uniref:uncharacterized protein n=1 Tax=Triticum aestivum TaxID=4565 RepID=UPI001D027045|nr:uncharacterized protein LOC123101527 [Triticum aestivum]
MGDLAFTKMDEVYAPRDVHSMTVAEMFAVDAGRVIGQFSTFPASFGCSFGVHLIGSFAPPVRRNGREALQQESGCGCWRGPLKHAAGRCDPSRAVAPALVSSRADVRARHPLAHPLEVRAVSSRDRVDADDEAYRCCQDLKRFIDSFLRCRDPTPLHECEILFDDDRRSEEFHQDFELWLRYAVPHKVRVLRFEILAGHDPLQLSAGALISEHLTTLILCCVEFEDFSLDVSGCQSLEVLEMHECVINIGTALPKSLKHLTIRDTSFGSQDSPCLTSAPGLVTLEVADCHGWTPLFKSLPSLVAAFINTEYVLKGSSGNSFNGYCGHEQCVVCHGIADFVFLEGLSGATNLELTAEYFMIFRTDIEWCPMFSRLKTLLLSDWCMAQYFHGLVFFLKHSPILERLTLEHCTLSKV